MRQMAQHKILDPAQIINTLHILTQTRTVPLSIFSAGLYPLESLSLYLHDHQNLSFSEIARLLFRNQRSVWAAYRRALGKHASLPQRPSASPPSARQSSSSASSGQISSISSALPLHPDSITIPLSIFTPSRSLQSSLIFYLKYTYRLTNKQVAELLNTTPNSIAVTLKRGEKT